MDNSTIHFFFQCLNAQDSQAIGELLAEDAVFDFPTTQLLVGKERILKFLNLLFRQYPELSFDIQHIILQDKNGAVHWKNRGKNRRGEFYENEGVTLFRTDGVKICFLSDFFKNIEKF